MNEAITFFCRLCAELQSETQLININDEKSANLNLAYKIFHCFLVKITEDDDLPTNICGICCDKVISAYEFYNQVQNAQEVLKGKLVEVKNELNDTSDDLKCDNFIDNSPNFEMKLEEFEDDTALLERKRGRPKGTKTDKIRKLKIVEKPERKILKEWKNYKWKCVDCSDELNSVKELRIHYSSIHDKPTQYACVECSQVYDNYDRFKSHSRVHRKKYRCDLCGKSCFHRAHLEHHLLTHSNSTPYRCLHCDKAFKTPKSLLSHQKSHLPNEIKYKYECELCQKKFTTKRILLFHKKNHTSGTQNYICDQCGRHFRQKTNLNQHIATHLEVAPYHCEQCPKVFKNIYRLRKHQKSHTEEKTHTCEVCRRAFREKRALVRHAKIHTGELPHECEYCKKCFRLKSFLKIHLRQHTGERPYSCLECNHFFANSSNFIKHMKGRHGMNHFSVAQQHQFPSIG